MKTYYPTNRTNLLDTFDDFFKPMFYDIDNRAMKTDIIENENEYQVITELAGYTKENVTINFQEGYLTIGAKQVVDKDEDAKKGKYILRERCTSAQRSFYVGDVNKENITATFENGVLTVVIPKSKPEEKQYRISIN